MTVQGPESNPVPPEAVVAPAGDGSLPAPLASGLPSPPVSPAGPRRHWIPYAAAAVAVIVVLSVLALSGVLTRGGGSAGTQYGTPAPYSQAVGPAQTAAATVSGGPWTLRAAFGVAVSASSTGATAGEITGSGCTATAVPGGPSTFSLDATPSNATAGTTAVWIFFATDPTDSETLLTVVTDGVGVPVALVGGASCSNPFVQAATIGDATVVDSTVVAAAIDSAGGSAFLSGHSVQTQSFILLGVSASSGGPEWYVSYSTCPLVSAGGTGTAFTGVFNATSGQVVLAPSAVAANC